MGRRQHSAVRDPEAEERQDIEHIHRTEVDRLQQEAEDLGRVHKRIKDDIDAEQLRGEQIITEKRRQVDEETARLDAEIETKRKQHIDIVSENERLVSSNARLLSENTLLEEQNAHLVASVAGARQEEEKVKKHILIATAEHDVLRGDIKSESETLNGLRGDTEKERVRCEEMRSAADTEERRRDEAIIDVARAVSNKEDLEKKTKELDAELSVKRSEYQKISSDIDSLRKESVNIKAGQDARETELNVRAGRIADLEQWVDTKLGQLDEAKKYFTSDQLARFGISSSPKA